MYNTFMSFICKENKARMVPCINSGGQIINTCYSRQIIYLQN